MKRSGEDPPSSRAKPLKTARISKNLEDYFDESEDDEELATMHPSNADGEDNGEEEDELEVFMKGVQAEAATEPKSVKEHQEVYRSSVFEDEDRMHGFEKHLQQKQQKQLQDDQNENDLNSNSDYDASHENLVRKDIEPLQSIDHSAIHYQQFERNFYEPDNAINLLTEEELRRIRHSLNMTVTGYAPPPPCSEWDQFGFGDILLRTIKSTGWNRPTGIQSQAIATAMAGRDLLAIAKTGSGKTAAFVIPLLIHAMDQPELSAGDGPIGLILAPTRELAVQIHTEAKKLSKAYGIHVSVVYGGADKTEQFRELRKGCEILVATPGRLIDMVKMKATNLTRVTYLVLDEADRMFDLGFDAQVSSICDNVRPDRQTLLFSATLPRKIGTLAWKVLNDPVNITIGNVGQANIDVHQHIHILDSDNLKYPWLTTNLPSFINLGSIIIFVSRKEGVEGLHQNLTTAGFQCGAMHGDMLQGGRDRVMRDFRKGVLKILIATDIAARGLDIKDVKAVINYDIARDIDSHIHRIGRTGRAGTKGDAFTLLTRKENKFAGDLVRCLESGGQGVPKDLLELAMTFPRFRSQRESRSLRRQTGRSVPMRGGMRRGLGYQ